MDGFLQRLALVAGVLALLAPSHGASAHGYKKNGIAIVHPWVMETAAGDSSVYMKIANDASEPDRLIAVTSPLADRAGLEANGQAAQPSVADHGFVVPARGELILKKAGPHIALGGLKKPLHAYGTVPMSLVFERAGKLDIEVMVEEAE